MKLSSSYSLLKFVYLTGQWRHSLEVHPFLRKILDPSLLCTWFLSFHRVNAPGRSSGGHGSNVSRRTNFISFFTCSSQIHVVFGSVYGSDFALSSSHNASVNLGEFSPCKGTAMGKAEVFFSIKIACNSLNTLISIIIKSSMCARQFQAVYCALAETEWGDEPSCASGGLQQTGDCRPGINCRLSVKCCIL